MKIAREYVGEKYVVIIRNEAKHTFIVRGSSDLLNKEIPLYKRGEDSRTIARYEGVNDEALGLIKKAMIDLNEGKKIDLECLLTKVN
jgi:hypothetical protein